MARPNGLQKLRHDRFLTRANFPRFVETWNWIVTAFDSMVGDRDTNPQNGHIFMDRTNQDRPIIRCFGCGGNGGGGAGYSGRFEINLFGDYATFLNPFYDVGGKTYEMKAEDAEIDDIGDGEIVALSVTATGSVPGAIIVKAHDLAALQQMQGDKSQYVMPLYMISNGRVTCDFRIGSAASQGEF